MKEVKQREVEQFLKQQGWTLARTKAGHRIWKSPNGKEHLAIPAHTKTSAGVIRQIIKKIPNTPHNWR